MRSILRCTGKRSKERSTRGWLRWERALRRWETTRHAFAYVFDGSWKFCSAPGLLAVPTEGVGWADTGLARAVDSRSLVLFDSGDEVTVEAGEDCIRFLLVSGQPPKEPVAWSGRS